MGGLCLGGRGRRCGVGRGGEVSVWFLNGRREVGIGDGGEGVSYAWTWRKGSSSFVEVIMVDEDVHDSVDLVIYYDRSSSCGIPKVLFGNDTL